METGTIPPTNSLADSICTEPSRADRATSGGEKTVRCIPTRWPPGAWYSTVVGSDAASGGSDAANGSTGDVIRVRIRDGDLEWESTIDAESPVRRLLRLADDLEAIVAAGPNDPLLHREAYEAHRGMRLVADPPRLPDLVYLLGTDARRTDSHDGLDAGPRVRRRDRFRRRDVSRVSDAGTALRPRPRLNSASSVWDTALPTSSGPPRWSPAARIIRPRRAIFRTRTHGEYLTRFVGVGDKVADCVPPLLAGLRRGRPRLDTWIKSAIEEYYPDCDRGTYADTSRALRERLGASTRGTPRPTSFITSDWRIGTLPNETPGTIFMNGLSLPYGDRAVIGLLASAVFIATLGILIKYFGMVRLIAGYDPDRVADEDGLANFIGTNALYVAALVLLVAIVEYTEPFGGERGDLDRIRRRCRTPDRPDDPRRSALQNRRVRGESERRGPAVHYSS